MKTINRMLPDWLYDHEYGMVRPGPRSVATAGLVIGARANLLRRKRWKGWKKRFSPLRIHLGCGAKYVPGWVNIDINPLRRVDLWLDITAPLPFEENEVQAIASFHVLEHLDPREAHQMLAECQRVLQPGGLFRVGVPSLEMAIEAYNRDDWKVYKSMTLSASSPGGKFNQTILYHGQHKQAYDFRYLAELLKAVGFRTVQRVDGWESTMLSRDDLEKMQIDSAVEYSLVAEACK
ncbi:MAG TPA: methyltransferase domain-containing protein [Chloroflexota bacterium]|nr:methyltransferase domain-containing protein [Chloroflexota bacterium]